MFSTDHALGGRRACGTLGNLVFTLMVRRCIHVQREYYFKTYKSRTSSQFVYDKNKQTPLNDKHWHCFLRYPCPIADQQGLLLTHGDQWVIVLSTVGGLCFVQYVQTRRGLAQRKAVRSESDFVGFASRHSFLNFRFQRRSSMVFHGWLMD